jgi:hypothetical protein
MKRFLFTLMLVALASIAARGDNLVWPRMSTIACPNQNAIDQVYTIVKDAARGRESESFLKRRMQELDCLSVRPKDGPFEIKSSDGGYCEIKEQYFDVRAPSKWVVCAAMTEE